MEFDYLKLCPNYYTDWEEGCCMENCTLNDINECPIHYVKGLLEEKDKEITQRLVIQEKDYLEQLALTEKALELACDCFYNNFGKALEPYCECNISSEAMQKHFKTKAEEMMSDNGEQV